MTMEVAMALFLTGCYLVILAMWRKRKLTSYSRLLAHFDDYFNLDKLDASGNTEYTECFSHRWVMKEITTPEPGRLTSIFQEHMKDNALFGSLWVGFILAASSMILVLLLLGAIRALGFALPIFAVGIIMSFGSSSLKESEQLLNTVQSVFPSGIAVEDYLYVKIAYDTLERWVILSGVVGGGLMLVSPFGEYIPTLAAFIIAQVARFILWAPALFLLKYSVVLTILYLGLGVILISHVIISASRIMVAKLGGFRKSVINNSAQNFSEDTVQEIENPSKKKHK
ncbi:MAG: hypothetical protein KGY80_10960 [Candidatus Thorarchaeota archaeon]|nr:hypothetical protein [Candidatus Thorarchaeota archaeon]